MTVISTPQVWSGLRLRRGAVLAVVPAFVIVEISGSLVAILLTIVCGWAALTALQRWRCPRCSRFFNGVSVHLARSACEACALPAFAGAESIQDPAFLLSPSAGSMHRGLRRVVAGSQILTGGIIFVLSALQRQWFFFGLAFGALFAGSLLWQDRRAGYRLTRLLVALQVLKLVAPQLVVWFDLGPQVVLARTAERFGMEVQFFARGQLLWGPQQGWYVGVNLFALLVSVVMLGAEPSRE